MKVISLLQPWASLVVIGAKKVETRSWNAKHRGTLLIHASAKEFKPVRGMEDLMANMEWCGFFEKVQHMPYGAIIGQVELTHTDSTEQISEREVYHYGSSYKWQITKQEKAFGDYSPGRYGWLLSNAIEFIQPIPAKGSLSIWEWSPTLDDQIMIENSKQIASLNSFSSSLKKHLL
jgi:hypothetical protein